MIFIVDPKLPVPTEPKTKRKKTDAETSSPHITIEKPEQKIICSNFMMAVNCWDLLQSSEHLKRGEIYF